MQPAQSYVTDPAALVAALRSRIEGEVRFSDGDRALYATDASNYRQVPIGVVIPKSRADVSAAVDVCRRFGVPILARGAGTSLAGQCCNVAVVLDMSKYLNRILEIDPERRIARVEPGVTLDQLRDAAVGHGLTFGPDPSTHRWCTLGGMIGNNACGVRSVMARLYGPGPRTEHQVEEMEILTYEGEVFRVGPANETGLAEIIAEGGPKSEIYRRLVMLRDRYEDAIRGGFPDIPRRVSGYNLDQLLPENGFNVARALVGTESTCAIVLEATVRLIPALPHRALLIAGYPSVFEAGDHVPEVLKLRPLGVEGIDDLLVEFVRRSGIRPETAERLLRDAGGWLLIEFGGATREEANERAHQAVLTLEAAENPPKLSLYTDPETQAEMWEIRESALAATAWVPGEDDAWEGWEDSAVPPEHVGAYLRDFRRLLDRYAYRTSSTAIWATAAFTAVSTSICARRRGSESIESSSTRPPISSSPTADLFQVSMATVSRARSCWSGCMARSSSERSGSSNPSGIRTDG
jgi:FAD/FMN-containing dehydrogenase